MSAKPKRIVLMGDYHCGHLAGLTPPDWWGCNPRPMADKWRKLHEECWTWYAKTLAALGQIDVLVVNGDAIDGSGGRCGATEHIVVDRKDQADMAVACIEEAKAKRTILTYGTAYHVGEEEDWESIIADKVNAKIGSHEWLNCNGYVIDLKHHIGSSSVPYGRHTAGARDRVWNLLWSEREQQPKANMIVRSHVHYHAYSGTPDYVAMTLPALQAAGTKYGSRRCSGLVDFGFVSVDISRTGEATWRAHLAQLQNQKAHALHV